MMDRRSLLGCFIGTVAAWPFAAVLKPRYRFQTYVVTDRDEVIYSPIPKVTRGNCTNDHVSIVFNTQVIEDFRFKRTLKYCGICCGEYVITKRDLDIAVNTGDSLTLTQILIVDNVPEYMLKHYLKHTDYMEDRSIRNLDNIDKPKLTENIYDYICQELGEKVLV